MRSSFYDSEVGGPLPSWDRLPTFATASLSDLLLKPGHTCSHAAGYASERSSERTSPTGAAGGGAAVVGVANGAGGSVAPLDAAGLGPFAPTQQRLRIQCDAPVR